jgi:hypothetical protein
LSETSQLENTLSTSRERARQRRPHLLDKQLRDDERQRAMIAAGGTDNWCEEIVTLLKPVIEAEGFPRSVRHWKYYLKNNTDAFTRLYRGKGSYTPLCETRGEGYEEVCSALVWARRLNQEDPTHPLCISWDAIVDEARDALQESPGIHWPTQKEFRAFLSRIEFVKTIPSSNHIRVFTEKAAMLAPLRDICKSEQVWLHTVTGQSSWVLLKNIADDVARQDKHFVGIYLGDYNFKSKINAGLNIENSTVERLRYFGCDVEMVRVAMTEEDAFEHNAEDVDALSSDEIISRVRTAIEDYR